MTTTRKIVLITTGLLITALGVTGIAAAGHHIPAQPAPAAAAAPVVKPPVPGPPAQDPPAPKVAPVAQAPKPAPKAKPKPKAPTYTCEMDQPVKFGPDGNTIINRACGYTDDKGRKRSSDPWIDGQLDAARGGKAPKPLTVEEQRRVTGENALAACTAQTGMTRAQCIADAKAGNAS